MPKKKYFCKNFSGEEVEPLTVVIILQIVNYRLLLIKW